MDILQSVRDIEKQIITWRRDLHKNPEIENCTPQTRDYIAAQLDQMGISYEKCESVTGLIAHIQGAKDGKTIVFRADMDALPVSEETGLDFASQNDYMHACGHDAHAAMLLGAAKVLNDNKDKLPGNVRLLFQPGEEYPGGAEPMIAEGCLDGADAIFGLHIGNLIEGLESGQVAVHMGNSMACKDSFFIKVIGRGGHSSVPHLSIDPIAISAQLINGLYMIKGRELPALSPSVISVCTIHGGTASNIIPDEVVIEGSTRSVDDATRQLIAKRIQEVAKSTCQTYGATCDFTFEWGYPVLKNNEEMAKLAAKSACQIVGTDNVFTDKDALMGSEDMSFYLNKLPGAYFFLGSIVSDNGVIYGHHSPKFMLDESAFIYGSAIFVQIVMDYFKN